MTFQCRTADCDKTVAYDRADGRGESVRLEVSVSPSPSRKVVYLTCEDGHENRYVVEEP